MKKRRLYGVAGVCELQTLLGVSTLISAAHPVNATTKKDTARTGAASKRTR